MLSPNKRNCRRINIKGNALKGMLLYIVFQINTILAFTSDLTLKVLVTTTDAQWEGMGDVGSARYEPALLPPCPTIRVLCYSNCQRSTHSHQQFKG